jgi:high affinity Mn2+ porin
LVKHYAIARPRGRSRIADLSAGVALAVGISVGAPLVVADELKLPSFAASSTQWTGFYFGGHLGNAWGNSNWSTPGVTGSTSLAQTLDTFAEAGSFFEGIQGGYNYMLANRVIIGVEGDASFAAFPNLSGFGIGGQSNFTSPTLGAETYSDNLRAFGTVRGRLGYAPDNGLLGNWLIYATGGFAWSRDQLSLSQNATSVGDFPQAWRVGWAAGAGVEAPIAPHWTARFEYLFTDYGAITATFPSLGQPFSSNLTVHEVRAGLNYYFDDAAPAKVTKSAPESTDSDRINFHSQATFTAQGYPAIRSPYAGTNSLLGRGQAAETADGTLYGGLRLWSGAEAWINPEIDQGFGLANTHGAAGFPSAEAYKLGESYPYARVQRYFLRQTINLGGENQNVDADINQFAGTQTANRLVLSVGKFAVVDIFDTNKYANNSKSDFLNWSMVNAGTFDYAGDGWGFTYGGAAELYVDRFAFRAGVFDLSQTPAGGGANAPAYGLDPSFSEQQYVGEVEERHQLWGQPGKVKLTGFLSWGQAGSFQDAIALSQATGLDASDALAAVRHYQARPGVSVNFEQQVSDNLGVFGRAGWADGNVEPWDFTDIDRTLQGGVSLTGKQWGRPDDTIGVAGVLNGISGVHAAYFNAGGMGILVGDGALPNPTTEKIFETYYSVALTAAVKLSFDYQFIADPGYNADRGPASIGAIRLHAQF